MNDKSPSKLPPADKVRERLDYDPDTGVLTWRHCETMPQRWNTRWAGTVAGCIDSNGYRMIKIDGRLHLAHRLAWLMTTGSAPNDKIDHINGDRADNRIANLRADAVPRRRLRTPTHNRSGNIGVCWTRREGKWRAYITVDGRVIHIGCFTVKADAIAARKAAEITHGFHPNHGMAAA